jgi:uncharacterized membrane protein
MYTHTVSAHHGSQWIVEGWALFRVRPAVWVALGAIDLVVTVLLSMIPVISDLTPVFTVLWAGGMSAAAENCRTLGTVRVADAFDGIRRHAQPLFAASLVALAAALVCDFAASRMAASFNALALATPGAASASAPWLAALLYAVAVIGAALTLWLAPSLIVLERIPPLDALKASAVATWRNPLAALVYGVFIAGLAGAALVTLGIGLIVLAPLAYLSTFAAYRDLFANRGTGADTPA